MSGEDVNARIEQYWRDQLQHPDWYIRLEDYLRKDIFPVVHDNPALSLQRNRFYDVVTQMLIDRQIPLATSGPNLDSERQPIDTVVIHHTEENPDISLGKLSAIGFIRQYAQRYLDDDIYGHKGLKGQPIWSGHFRNGEMVFFAYHWLVRPDGTTDRLLDDQYVGRHALDLNPKSIGISLSGNYEHSTPPEEQVIATGKIIKESYPFIKPTRIFGHLEVMQQRTCPGNQFIRGWKGTILEAVKNS